MVYWRFHAEAPCAWRFGYVTHVKGCELIRMGIGNGDTTGGPVVSASEIEFHAISVDDQKVRAALEAEVREWRKLVNQDPEKPFDGF